MNTRFLKRVGLGLAIVVLGFCAHAARNVTPEQIYCDIGDYVMVNSDNDDNDPAGTKDYDKPKPVTGEDDLVVLELRVDDPTSTNETATLTVTSPNAHVRVWEVYTPLAIPGSPPPTSTWTHDPIIDTPGTNTHLFGYLTNAPFANKVFWVEGLSPSAVTNDVTFTLSTSGGTNATDSVTVLIVELLNSWETDAVCNRVTNPKQKSTNRLFVATEGSAQAEITVKANILPVGIRDKFLCAIYDESTHLESDAFSAASEAKLKFTPTGPANNYLLKIGIDKNSNSTLESSEFYATVTKFDLTGFTSVHYDDERTYLSGRATSIKLPFPVAASLLIHFLNRTDIPDPFDGTATVGINCFTQLNLTHNAGETFAAGGFGTLGLNSWNSSSKAGERIANSYELTDIIDAILDANKATVTSYFATHPTVDTYTATWTQNNVPVNFAEENYFLHPIEFDLHNAFGHALISISVNIIVKKSLLGDLYIDSLIETGTLEDLYDFDYEAGGDASKAAVLQIGWDPGITGRDAGHIFFDRVNFQETFNNWKYYF